MTSTAVKWEPVRTTFTMVKPGDAVQVKPGTGAQDPSKIYPAPIKAPKSAYWAEVAEVKRNGRYVTLVVKTLTGTEPMESAAHGAITVARSIEQDGPDTEGQRITRDMARAAEGLSAGKRDAAAEGKIVKLNASWAGVNTVPLITGHDAESHSRRGRECRICGQAVAEHELVNVKDGVAVAWWTGTAYGATVNPERVAQIEAQRYYAAQHLDSLPEDLVLSLPGVALVEARREAARTEVRGYAPGDRVFVDGEGIGTVVEVDDVSIDVRIDHDGIVVMAGRAQVRLVKDAATVAAESLFTGDTSDVDYAVERLVEMLPAPSGSSLATGTEGWAPFDESDPATWMPGNLPTGYVWASGDGCTDGEEHLYAPDGRDVTDEQYRAQQDRAARKRAQAAADAHYVSVCADPYSDAAYQDTRTALLAAIESAYPNVPALRIEDIWIDCGEPISWCAERVQADMSYEARRAILDSHGYIGDSGDCLFCSLPAVEHDTYRDGYEAAWNLAHEPVVTVVAPECVNCGRDLTPVKGHLVDVTRCPWGRCLPTMEEAARQDAETRAQIAPQDRATAVSDGTEYPSDQTGGEAASVDYSGLSALAVAELAACVAPVALASMVGTAWRVRPGASKRKGVRGRR